MKLLLTEYGTAILTTDSGEQVWSSDDDADFLEEFGDDFIRDEDAEEIIEYLEEKEELTDDEAEDIEIEVRSLDDTAGDSDDDDNDSPWPGVLDS